MLAPASHLVWSLELVFLHYTTFFSLFCFHHYTFKLHITCACVKASLTRDNNGFPSSRDYTSPNKGHLVVDL